MTREQRSTEGMTMLRLSERMTEISLSQGTTRDVALDDVNAGDTVRYMGRNAYVCEVDRDSGLMLVEANQGRRYWVGVKDIDGHTRATR